MDKYTHITVNIATQPHRLNTLMKVIESMQSQSRRPDEINIYWNGIDPPEIDGVNIVTGANLTDNGKFAFFKPNDGVYFTCDDDIAYPNNYIEYTLKKLRSYPECILSYHGRRLTNREERYYRRPTPYRFSNALTYDALLDVPGTGVMVFDSAYFDVSRIAPDPRQRMTDVLVGLEAMQQGIQIICPARRNLWLRDIGEDGGIYEAERMNDAVQTELCKVIFDNKLTF